MSEEDKKQKKLNDNQKELIELKKSNNDDEIQSPDVLMTENI